MRVAVKLKLLVSFQYFEIRPSGSRHHRRPTALIKTKENYLRFQLESKSQLWVSHGNKSREKATNCLLNLESTNPAIIFSNKGKMASFATSYISPSTSLFPRTLHSVYTWPLFYFQTCVNHRICRKCPNLILCEAELLQILWPTRNSSILRNDLLMRSLWLEKLSQIYNKILTSET